VSSNATWFEDVGAITNANAQNDTYSVEAVYPGGSLSGTNTWQVSWYANYSSYGPPYGPPLPGNVYAYADVTGTNVLLSWTPPGGSATNYIILHGVSTNYSYIYQQVAQVSTNTLSTEIFGVLTNLNDWSDGYAVEAVYPGGALSYAASSYIDYPVYVTVNVGSNTNTNAPANFYGFPDSTGTNIFLTWGAVSGATNYIVYGASYDYGVGVNVHTILAKVGAPTNSFTVRGAIDGSGNNLYEFYNVVAVYPNGTLSSNAVWYSSSGAPAPGALSAYLDATGTNVMLSWSSATGATGYLIQKSDYYGEDWSYYELTQVGSTTFSYEDVDGVDSGYDGASSIVYEVQATYPNGGLSPAVTATIATTPPAPSNLSAVVDSTGTNVSLAWSPAVGTVTGFTILRGTYNSSTGNYSYSTVGTVGAGTTSFQDTGAITGGNSGSDIYEVEANYADGSVSQPDFSLLSQSSTPSSYNINITAQMIRNQTGHWQLMFSSIPTNVQAVAFYWYLNDNFYGGAFPDTFYDHWYTPEVDIPVSSLTNGIYVIPDFLATNWIPDNSLGKVAFIQPIGTNNERGSISQAGFLPYDAPCFVDGRQHLKQNLLFALREATISQPNSPLAENNVYDDPFYFSIGIPTDTNYVESSIFHWSEQFNAYDLGDSGTFEYIKMDDLWPFTANYELHQSLYDPSYTGPSSFVWQTNLVTIPASAVLGVSDPYWISQGVTSYVINPATGLPTLVFNSSITDLAAYTNSGSLFLQSGVHNLFGLAFETALVNQSPVTTLATGGSVALTNANCFFSQTADPSLQITNYYFAPVNTPGTALAQFSTPYQPYPLPAHTGFANTNQTQVMIASVGNPIVIGGWAKEKILNGSSTKFGYLGQYFVTNAYVVNTNGTLATNTTGIVSPYGDFFPTEPGAVAMVTMPDIDTGQQGTGVVRVVSLNVDANHDGTLNFKYNSPDFVSSSKPFRFWVNDDSDAFDDYGNGIPQDQPWYITDGFSSAGTTPYSTLPMLPPVPGGFVVEPFYQVHGTRDLVDYFPVYLNIGSLFQSNALSAGISVTDTNYYFICLVSKIYG
jgi:hypothetical protein